MTKKVLQIKIIKGKKPKTKFGRWFHREIRLEIRLWISKFKASFYGNLVKFMYWLFPKKVTDKWDEELAEELSDSEIQIVSDNDEYDTIKN